MVSLAEAAVDADFPSFSPDRRIPLGHLDRRVPIDNVRLGRIQAEFVKNPDADLLFPMQAIVRVLRFGPRRFVVEKAPFEGLDDAACYRRIGMDPEIEEKSWSSWFRRVNALRAR